MLRPLLAAFGPILFGSGALCANVARAGLSCQGCLQIADALATELEPPPSAPANDLVGVVGPRRKMMHPRSEPEIYAAIDNICTKVAMHKPRLLIPCNSQELGRMMTAQRDALENLVYAEGAQDLRRGLCRKLTGLCSERALSGPNPEL